MKNTESHSDPDFIWREFFIHLIKDRQQGKMNSA